MASTHNSIPPSTHDTGRRHAGRAQKDDIQDPYQTARKLHDPTLCPDCGAVYSDGRWQWAAAPAAAEREACPACRRIAEHFPAGIVTLTGPLVAVHGTEMIRLARNREEAEKAEHPLNRIIAVDESGERIVITTTDIFLPRRIGEALEHAFQGELKLNYDKDGYFIRVDWHRES